MSDQINLSKVPLKIAIIGPQRVGKSVLANTLSEFSQVVSTDYHPTVGCRILETEKEYTEEQIKNIPILKNSNKLKKIKIELWDVSGDRRYESAWPAIKFGLHGVIVVIDAMNNKYDNALDDWINGLCKDLNKDNIICFSYRKDDAKAGEPQQKTCNQFPNLVIAEVKNDMNLLLPHFNKLISKILMNMN